MRNAFLIPSPTGTGKTRTVLKRILWGTGQSLARFNRRLSKTVILGPNQRISDPWIREILIVAYQRNLGGFVRSEVDGYLKSHGRANGEVALGESGIHRLKHTQRVKLCAELGLSHPRFHTYQKPGPARRSYYLVLDEWHRVGGRFMRRCRGEGRGPRPWYITPSFTARDAFFVSATPVNPALESEEEIVSDPDSEVLKRKVRDAKLKATQIVRAVRSGVTTLSEKDKEALAEHTFLDYAKTLGLKLRTSAKKWRVPEGAIWPTRADAWREHAEQQVETSELSQLRLFIEGPQNYRHEYCFAAGLVRTKHRRLAKQKKRSGTSFTFPYSHVYEPRKPKTRSAARFLSRHHSRFPRLLSLLMKEGVLSQDLRLKKKKVLIFCTHRGVARGLRDALIETLRAAGHQSPKELEAAIQTNLDAPHKSARVSQRHLTEAFRNGEELKVLIVTDVLSESHDLHQRCQLLVHYELPWSPLRLLQRVGRLTRLKGPGTTTQQVRVAHVVLPGGVEEEIVNRLIRRTLYLNTEGLLPIPLINGQDERAFLEGIIGSGPSLHLREELETLGSNTS